MAGCAVAVNRIALEANDAHTTAIVLPAGGAALLILAAALGAAWRPAHVVEAPMLAIGAAVLVGMSSFLAWDPTAGSRTCPGPQDCDTGFSIGAMALIAIVFLPLLAAVLAGRGARELLRPTEAPPPAHVAPPGWYPDPWDLRCRRFWDGRLWTAYTAW
ncbi:MAG: hypothetical protein QOJ07_2863 [Thermoleophilaceae bacterium]|nr:hypothetical protein [Thermoleophilaceae bacterium]